MVSCHSEPVELRTMDPGFRRHDGVDSTFYYYDTVS